MALRTNSQSSAGARAARGAARINVKAVVNIGRVELEMLRNKPEIRTIEPLARFQVPASQRYWVGLAAAASRSLALTLVPALVLCVVTARQRWEHQRRAAPLPGSGPTSQRR